MNPASKGLQAGLGRLSEYGVSVLQNMGTDHPRTRILNRISPKSWTQFFFPLSQNVQATWVSHRQAFTWEPDSRSPPDIHVHSTPLHFRQTGQAKFHSSESSKYSMATFPLLLMPIINDSDECVECPRPPIDFLELRVNPSSRLR